MSQQIIAMGGGGFSEGKSTHLDAYVLAQASRDEPRICFIPTASGDSESYIARFYRHFGEVRCRPTHLALFRRDARNLTDLLCAQDVIYVGGGNTANMMAVWKVHGVDRVLEKAMVGGTVLAGLSAGAICWYEQGVTDSFGQGLVACDGLGFLKGSHCPHYTNESSRRASYHRLLQQRRLGDGIAADDEVALHYVDGRLLRVVAAGAEAGAYTVGVEDDRVVERKLDIERLDVIDA